MSEQKFFYSSAYLLAAPIAALIIGITLDRAYASKFASPKFRWGNNAVTLLALAFIVIILRENYASLVPQSDDLPNTGILERPSAAQVSTPATVGCVQFLVQVYYIQHFLKAAGKKLWNVACLFICAINFLTSWGCTISILIKLSKPAEVVDLSETGLPTFQLARHVLAAWLATSLLAELVIVAGNLYSGRSAQNIDQDKPFCFLKNDHILTKIGVVALQTSALSALIILTASSIFLADVLSGGQPSPGMTGCFVFLQLMRIPVGYSSLVFSIVRERGLSMNAIRNSLIATPNGTLKDFSLEGYKKSDPSNQVTVHTVTSQVFEN
ncbi:hypothetical protein PTTG_25962 [Puccinia triticina 1-1 BBBD Race 1]|uniref:Uncharacterized protein n=2 Tax=Puccinia triticina TaxID=208348 RepID=A0A180GY72_PUCT1|nr:uncharacterized protein PtA15_10A664 [Puccinia triticina]OAV97775.1 hypothetical protein PTTG_25962 [Puccinia triticina 1-1 BBBD Race 1]WAQ89240.1 hypothetical protein PtA15_10A664 [Puccinia triticina]WAR59292.1 hypothetical protein PtB15_10B634 [Puccinia triticina]